MDKPEMLTKLKLAASLIDEVTIALETPVPPPGESAWALWILAVVKSERIPHEVKPAVIAQSIIETGRGSSPLFRLHWNPLGMKWRDAMKGWGVPINVAVTSEPSGFGVFCKFSGPESAADGWARWMERDPYDGWRQHLDSAESFLRFVCPIWAADPSYLQKCLLILDEAVLVCAARGWKSDNPPPAIQRLRGKKILVDPGHSKSAQGASGRGGIPRPSEYAMNALQAKIVVDALRAAGAEVELFDPDPDSLTAIGRRAAGKDLFLSLHHNAANADGNDEGTETYIPYGSSNGASALAAAVNKAVVDAIGSKNRGVKVKDYTVIATAASVGCPICMLVESYFIDDYTSLDVTTQRSTEAAHAIAGAVIKGL